MYTIYKVVLPEDKKLQMFMNGGVGFLEIELFRFPEVIRISVQSSRLRALVFDFLVVKYFIHTILFFRVIFLFLISFTLASSYISFFFFYHVPNNKEKYLSVFTCCITLILIVKNVMFQGRLIT